MLQSSMDGTAHAVRQTHTQNQQQGDRETAREIR